MKNYPWTRLSTVFGWTDTVSCLSSVEKNRFNFHPFHIIISQSHSTLLATSSLLCRTFVFIFLIHCAIATTVNCETSSDSHNSVNCCRESFDIKKLFFCMKNEIICVNREIFSMSMMRNVLDSSYKCSNTLNFLLTSGRSVERVGRQKCTLFDAPAHTESNSNLFMTFQLLPHSLWSSLLIQHPSIHFSLSFTTHH